MNPLAILRGAAFVISGKRHGGDQPKIECIQDINPAQRRNDTLGYTRTGASLTRGYSCGGSDSTLPRQIAIFGQCPCLILPKKNTPKPYKRSAPRSRATAMSCRRVCAGSRAPSRSSIRFSGAHCHAIPAPEAIRDAEPRLCRAERRPATALARRQSSLIANRAYRVRIADRHRYCSAPFTRSRACALWRTRCRGSSAIAFAVPAEQGDVSERDAHQRRFNAYGQRQDDEADSDDRKGPSSFVP